MRLYALKGDQAGGSRAEGSRLPVLIMALGRGRVGKTVVLSTIGQYYRQCGAEIEIWNLDPNNESSPISRFFTDACQPAFTMEQDGKRWLEEKIVQQSRSRRDAILDVGGGDQHVRSLANEIKLVPLLGKLGIRPVALHVIGPDKADLDYLRQVSSGDLFFPPATVIVENAGLTQYGISPAAAFQPIMKDASIAEAVKKGAEVVMMPKLPCMTEVLERGQAFVDASNGVPAPNHEPLSFFDQERVARWWDQEIPAFFSAIPAAWMPAVHEGAEQ